MIRLKRVASSSVFSFFTFGGAQSAAESVYKLLSFTLYGSRMADIIPAELAAIRTGHFPDYRTGHLERLTRLESGSAGSEAGETFK